jgi:hypothetical protein
MSHLGPLLARSLVSNIGGHAARSELDKLSEPLKRLVTTRVEAQGWLRQALLDDSLFGVGGAAERVGREEREMFLRRVVG